jgi:hypothetical protein
LADVLEVALKWQAARRDVRKLLGDQYDERLTEYRKAIRAVAATRPPSEFVGVVVELAGALAKRAPQFGGAFVLAAGLDVLEERNRTVRDA